MRAISLSLTVFLGFAFAGLAGCNCGTPSSSSDAGEQRPDASTSDDGGEIDGDGGEFDGGAAAEQDAGVDAGVPLPPCFDSSDVVQHLISPRANTLVFDAFQTDTEIVAIGTRYHPDAGGGPVYTLIAAHGLDDAGSSGVSWVDVPLPSGEGVSPNFVWADWERDAGFILVWQPNSNSTLRAARMSDSFVVDVDAGFSWSGSGEPQGAKIFWNDTFGEWVVWSPWYLPPSTWEQRMVRVTSDGGELSASAPIVVWGSERRFEYAGAWGKDRYLMISEPATDSIPHAIEVSADGVADPGSDSVLASEPRRAYPAPSVVPVWNGAEWGVLINENEYAPSQVVFERVQPGTGLVADSQRDVSAPADILGVTLRWNAPHWNAAWTQYGQDGGAYVAELNAQGEPSCGPTHLTDATLFLNLTSGGVRRYVVYTADSLYLLTIP